MLLACSLTGLWVPFIGLQRALALHRRWRRRAGVWRPRWRPRRRLWRPRWRPRCVPALHALVLLFSVVLASLQHLGHAATLPGLARLLDWPLCDFVTCIHAGAELCCTSHAVSLPRRRRLR